MMSVWLSLIAMVTTVPSVANLSYPILKGGDLRAWEQREFVGQTAYRVIEDDQVQVLEAIATASASGHFKKVSVELGRYPTLRWRWRVDTPLSHQHVTDKSGDDFAARIYVVARHPTWPWKTIALCYVWSSGESKKPWPNPYVGAVQVVPLRTRDDPIANWVEESRDIAADFRTFFSLDIETVRAVGIMTDSDNTLTETSARYGDIVFEAK